MASAGHAAPGLVAAIHFQLKRVLLHLLSSETESSVTIEAPWDLAVVAADGRTLRAEEDKNSIVDVSQLTDRHEGLWKSLRNFTAAFVEKKLSPDAAVLTLCTNVEVGTGWASKFINRDWTEPEVWVMDRATELMDLAKCPSAAMKTHVAYLLQHPAEVHKVIRCLEVIDKQAVTKDGVTTKKIYQLLRAGADEQSSILEALMGWLGEFAADHIGRGEPAIIPVAAFNTRYREEIRLSRQTRLLRRLDEDFAAALTPDKKQRHIGDLFQQQLAWVGLDHSPAIVEQALEDFLKYEVAVTAYAEEGDIDRRQFSSRESEIQNRWMVIFNQECFTLPEDERGKAAIGRQVFHKSNSLDVPINGVGACESYLTRGALQHLANAPPHQPRIGWHPEYKTLVTKRNGDT